MTRPPDSQPCRRSVPPAAPARRGERGGLLGLLLGDLVRVGLFAALLNGLALQVSVVKGSSMLPNIHDGDRLVVDRFSYLFGEVERFDVVILECPTKPGVDYVKRVIGLPGDTIVLEAGKLSVNGRLLPEPFRHVEDGASFGIWRVPEGSYFVLGDNRPVSSDSREGWFVPRAAIKGRVRACLWPPADLGLF